MDSVLLIGNGLTLDTYNGAFSSIKIVNDVVQFFETEEIIFEDGLFSSKAYPEFVDYVNKHKEIAFHKLGKHLLENIILTNHSWNYDILKVYFSYLQYIVSRSRNDIPEVGKILEDKIHSYSSSINYTYVALYNSFCDYLYKLFWFYNEQFKYISISGSGVDKLTEFLLKTNKKPMVISLNYDMIFENHIKQKGIRYRYFGFPYILTEKTSINIFKPHGSINFLPNWSNPKDDGNVTNQIFYPILSRMDENSRQLVFTNISYKSYGLGTIIEEEKPCLMVDLVPPGCSNYFDIMDSKNKHLIKWAEIVNQGILQSLRNKKNLIIAGISFWEVDLWEIRNYVEVFHRMNPDGCIYILIYKKEEEERIIGYINSWKINHENVYYLYGSLTEKIDELNSYL